LASAIDWNSPASGDLKLTELSGAFLPAPTDAIPRESEQFSTKFFFRIVNLMNRLAPNSDLMSGTACQSRPTAGLNRAEINRIIRLSAMKHDQPPAANFFNKVPISKHGNISEHPPWK